MNHYHFAVLNCNLFIIATYLTEKIGPMVLAALWALFAIYVVYQERNK